MDYKNLTKEKILKNETSKFDMVPNLIPVEILITEKPSSLISALAKLLDIKPKDINANAFRQWRHRLIKKKTTSSYSTAHVKKTKINHLKKETGNKTDQEKL